MPLFPGERLMTPTERDDPHFRANALPGLDGQTGLTPGTRLHFSIVHTEANGGFDYVVVRPFLARTTVRIGRDDPPQPNPDTWWVWDADADESECWVPQATFTPEGYIDYRDDPRFADFDRTMEEREDDEPDDPDPLWDPRVPVTGREDPTPRDPNAPVTATIDLDEHEVAEREGIGAWEEHEHFSVLLNENGFAVVDGGASGAVRTIVRYPDKTACTFNSESVKVAREQAEKFLAKRPYKTAMERVLGGPDFDDEPAAKAEPEKPFDPPTSPAVPSARPVKRVWTTVPIDSAEDDD